MLKAPSVVDTVCVSGRHIRGGLDLVIDAQADSAGRVTRMLASAPVHVSKPYRDGQTSMLQLACPTGGLLPGDAMVIRTELKHGARFVLSSPAATRIQPGQEARAAEVVQDFEVSGEDAWLEVAPLGTLMQKGAALEQQTTLRVRDGGAALLCDVLWPGRIAHNEAFNFDHIKSRTRIEVNGKVVALERMHITPENRQGQDWQRAFSKPSILATLFFISDKWDAAMVQSLHDLHEQDRCWIGASSLSSGGAVIRVLSTHSGILQEKLAAIRTMLYELQGIPLLNLRRL